MSNAKLIWITPDAEKVMMYCARVSSDNQNSSNTKLLNYCINHGHWSVFEMANMCVEVTTTRDISAQMIRHKSYSFQEFSQRYAKALKIVIAEPRRQDLKNRQNSIDDLPPEVVEEFKNRQEVQNKLILENYQWSLDNGIAKECARKLLSMNTETKLYMSGTIRSFLHYLKVRTDPSTQLEHREVAKEIELILAKECPIIYTAIKGG